MIASLVGKILTKSPLFWRRPNIQSTEAKSFKAIFLCPTLYFRPRWEKARTTWVRKRKRKRQQNLPHHFCFDQHKVGDERKNRRKPLSSSHPPSRWSTWYSNTFLERTFPLHAFMFLALLLAFTDVEIFELKVQGLFLSWGCTWSRQQDGWSPTRLWRCTLPCGCTSENVQSQ